MSFAADTKIKWLAKCCLFLAGSIAMLFVIVFLIGPVIFYLVPNPVNAMGVFFQGKPLTYPISSLIADYKRFGPLAIIVITPPVMSYFLYRRNFSKCSLLFSVAYLLVILTRPWK